ncbi:MAG: hypothetical protein K2L75_06655 [Muribaculaceae bacterium]|nr:hypothetical protein [Muribaculaceae bacterium]
MHRDFCLTHFLRSLFLSPLLLFFDGELSGGKRCGVCHVDAENNINSKRDSRDIVGESLLLLMIKL